MGTVRKRGDRYEIDYYVNGKRVREAVGRTKKEAQEILGKRLEEIREGKYFERRSIRRVLMEDLVEEYRAKFRGKSIQTENGHLNTIKTHFAGKLVSQVTIYEIETFLAIRRDTPIKRKDGDHPRSAATCNRELSALKRLINKAVEWGMATTNPVPKVRPLPEPNGRTRFLSLDESRRLLEGATRHLRPILLTALETGMRRGEIFRMRWEDVDLKRGTIFIGEAKNGHPRYVPISDRLRVTLSKLPRRLGCDFVFSGEPKIGQTGKPFNDVRTSFEKACLKAGIENFRFHDLRHTAASHMVMAGVDLKTVGDILGHRSITMTERYSHLTPEHKRKAVNLLPDWSAGEADRSQNGRKTGKAGK